VYPAKRAEVFVENPFWVVPHTGMQLAFRYGTLGLRLTGLVHYPLYNIFRFETDYQNGTRFMKEVNTNKNYGYSVRLGVVHYF
jgi:hypothetical protein